MHQRTECLGQHARKGRGQHWARGSGNMRGRTIPELAWIDVSVSELSRRKKDMWIPGWLAVCLQGEEWGGKMPLWWNKNVGKQTLT